MDARKNMDFEFEFIDGNGVYVVKENGKILATFHYWLDALEYIAKAANEKAETVNFNLTND